MTNRRTGTPEEWLAARLGLRPIGDAADVDGERLARQLTKPKVTTTARDLPRLRRPYETFQGDMAGGKARRGSLRTVLARYLLRAALTAASSCSRLGSPEST